MNFKKIDSSWLILALLVCMTLLRALNFDTFVTAALSGITFYLLGRHTAPTTLSGTVALPLIS